jgi:hypothetical protein
MQWLDKVPLLPLAIAAALLGLAPLDPEPHLWEKLKMLASGTPLRKIDIVDFVMHASLPCLLGLRLIRLVMLRRRGDLPSK